MRSIFSAGLLDGFLAQQFNPFDMYFGVSAGAYNLAVYLAGRQGLSLRIYSEIVRRREFISYWRFLRGGHLLDLDWLTQSVNATCPLGPEQVLRHNRPFYVAVTAVQSGEAVYIAVTPRNLEQVIKASMALPLIYRDFPLVDGTAMTDGGVADGIPVAEAIRLGATDIMVVRSRWKDYVKRDTPWHRYIRWKLKDRPRLVQTMRERVARFEAAIQIIRNPPGGVRIQEVCPPREFAIGRFNRSSSQLQQGYTIGRAMADNAIRQWTRHTSD